MRMFIVSSTGIGLSFERCIANEGHQVTPLLALTGGMGEVVATVTQAPPDIAIFDADALYETADKVRTLGVRVLGATKWSNLLVTNNEYKDSLIRAVGFKPAGDSLGTNVVVGCLFNGQTFISRWLSFNYTRFMAGDTGTDVGSAGFVSYFNVAKSGLVAQILTPLERFLRKAGHRGQFLVYTTVTDKGEVLVNDISASLDKPFILAVYENSFRGKSDILLDIFNESSAPIPYIEPFVNAVLLSVYPFPYTIPENPLEIVGLNPYNTKHLWMVDAAQVDGKRFCGALSGCFGFVTGRGKTVEEANRRVNHTLSNIKIEGIQYRNDIGKGVGVRMHELRRLNLI